MIVGIEQLKLSPLRTTKAPPKPSTQTMRQIVRHGQIEPVVVRQKSDGAFEILANAEMWIAVQMAGGHDVNITVLEGLSDKEAAAIINDANALDPVTEAEWFKSQLCSEGEGRGFGSVASLARSVKKSREYVSHSLRLLGMSDTLKSAIRMGLLKAGHAKALLTVKDENQRNVLATRAIKERWTVRKLESEARDWRLGRESIPSTANKSADVVSLEKQLSGLIGSNVEIDVDAGKLVIDYRRNNDVLDGVLKRMGYSAD